MADAGQKTLIYLAHDNLNLSKGALRDANPRDFEVVLVESDRMLRAARWHRQRLFFMLSAARHFARELEGYGYRVHYLKAKGTASGILSISSKYPKVISAEPSSFRLYESLRKIGVEFVPNDFFLTTRKQFQDWADTQKTLKMENFYRWQRVRLNLLMDGGEPVGGKWNLDDENRLPPPKEPYRWPQNPKHERDEIDLAVISEIESLDLVGKLDDTTWGTTRDAALSRLQSFLKESFEEFGPYEDAMTIRSWALHHSLLSPYLNLGLITADEVIEAALESFRDSKIPLSSCEGFVRQIIGWREYINGIYWHFGPEYRDSNNFNSQRSLLPLFEDSSKTKMKCVSEAMTQIEDRAWTHHIPRLMVLSNLATLADVNPADFLAWMRRVFIDASDWVMVPNVIGMSMHADGGRMSTKPYIAGGSYISRMSDYCKSCEYNPKTRVEDDSCPFTTLYWHFLDRHSARFSKNHRMFQQLNGLKKLADLAETRSRGERVLRGLTEGKI